MDADLQPITAEEAVEAYLNYRQNEVADATLRSHRSRLKHFKRWCEQEDFSNLNELTGRDLHNYRVWRRHDGNLSPSSEKSQQDCIRVFIRFLETIDAVRPELSTTVVSPTLSSDEKARDVMVGPDEAETILDYLNSYEYASVRHICWRLAWRAALRRGSLRSLDVDDYDPTEKSLKIVHRGETDTPLKNKERGERFIALSDETCELLDDWLADRRPEVSDEHGREPLLATVRGRPHLGTIQNYIYSATRPCFVSGGCPHGRDIDECDAASDRTKASSCPSSTSPHSVRRGAVTYWLSKEQPVPWISARANMSSEILDAHYDGRTLRDKMEQRRGRLDNI